MTELIKHAVNDALENRVNQVNAVVDPDNPLTASLSQFMHTKVKIHFFAKSLTKEDLPNFEKRKIYVDANQM